MNDFKQEAGYQRLDNGMGVNSNAVDSKKQNQLVAKTGAILALGGSSQTPGFYDEN